MRWSRDTLLKKLQLYFHLLSSALIGCPLPPPLRRRRLWMAPKLKTSNATSKRLWPHCASVPANLTKLYVPLYISECVLLQIISYDSPRGGVSVITEKGDVTASFLVVQHAKPTDSGTYSCSPSLGETVSVNVHVLRGKYHLHITVNSITVTNYVFVGPYMEFSCLSVYSQISLQISMHYCWSQQK